MPTIDLNAPLIDPSTRVWRIFPGAGYRFLENFRISGKAYLDLPSLTLPGNIATSDELLPRILASTALNADLAEKPKDKPKLADWQLFKSKRKTQHRGRLRRAVINLLVTAQPGDLVVLPEALSVGYINVGQIVDATIEDATFVRRGWEWTTKGRNIRWLRRVRENTVSSKLSDSLRNQHPFSLIEEDLYFEVFSVAFQTYLFKEEKVASIFNHRDDYLDADSALLGTIAKLSAAACQAIDLGKPGLGTGTLSTILAPVPIEYSCSQQIDIHSAGFNRYLSASLTPLVISAFLAILLALSGCDSKQDLQIERTKIVVVNSQDAAANPCAPPVYDATNRILQALSIDETWELCKAAKAAESRAGIVPTAKIVP